MIHFLNSLHTKGYYKFLSIICALAYVLKFGRFVRVQYHPRFRAYSFNDGQFVYMSLGPGWAYSRNYLKAQAILNYNFFYLPKAGDVVVDIGAGLGEESLLYAQEVGPNGRVIAVEANPTTFAGLAYAVKENNLQQLTPVNKALYLKNIEIFIEDNADNYLVNTISETKSTTGFNVLGIDFNTLVEEYKLDRIDFLKVNIEGAEQYLLASSKENFRKVKHLCISCHDFRENYHQHGQFYVTKEKIKAFLNENGYTLISREPYNNVVDDYLYAVKTD
ncbi:MAG: FkbM family methyltransferase [Cyclobacteriaceae bacterium]|jgi:FkbM family methyltransferase|nr:FkbM family methyltransferase [Cyclobacteriaceae bacterium]